MPKKQSCFYEKSSTHHQASTMTPEGQACHDLIIQSMDDYLLPCTDNAVRLLEMITAHESCGFMYSRQVNGPALGLFQIEPITFRDLCDYAKRKKLAIADEMPCSQYRMIFDPNFSAAMARVFFLRFPEPIPSRDDITGLSEYAKRYWNTKYGKATPEQYAAAWRKYFE